jgi:predicted nucleic acid-binding protein
MADKILVDTNVLLYAYDRGEPMKQPRALSLLNSLVMHDLGVLTSQVLAEFFVNATRNLQPPLTAKEAHERIQNYLLSWEILDITGAIVLEAIRGVRTHQMAYWDAQIWASARLNQIPVVLSEDFGDGVVIEGVKFVNPFGRNFKMEAWLPGSRTT